MASNLVSLVRNVQQRKGRKRSRLAVAEGVRLVEEALEAAVPLTGVLVGPGFGDTPRGAALVDRLERHAVPVSEVAERTMRELCSTETPQGVLALIEPPHWTLDAIQPARSAPVLVLDAVQDPGNAGTLLRTAWALGAAGAVLLKGTADLANPKVLRAGMGATFRFPSVAIDVPEFRRWLEDSGIVAWATAPQGMPLSRLKPPERLAIIVGNEGAGVRDAVQALAVERVAIPLARGAESLNVAVAAGIVLHEVRRVS